MFQNRRAGSSLTENDAAQHRESVTADEYSFTAFSEHAFFREVNAWLVEHAQLERGWRVVDVGCGSGLVTELILERVRGARDALVVALDVSTGALSHVRERFAAASGVVLEFVQARAEEMSTLVRHAMDAVVFCNGIHYIADKRHVLREIRETLRPGGTFAFNTSFFEGAQLPETLAFYRRWMLRALRTLKTRYNLTPDRTRVTARRQLTPAEYRAALEAEQFEVRVDELLTVTLDEQGWVDISRFADFVEGALPGIPIARASEVLCDAVRETFAELRLDGVPRNWLSVVATRA